MSSARLEIIDEPSLPKDAPFALLIPVEISRIATLGVPSLPSYIKQVSLRYYKSIGSCSVDLNDLTILVGKNGSGKSNFLDSISFVSDALSSTLDFAIRQRGGLGSVRKRSGGHPTNFTISLRLALPSGRTGVYAFQIGTDKTGRQKVRRELLSIYGDQSDPIEFEYQNGRLINNIVKTALPDEISDDRLALQLASTFPDTREVFDVIASSYFYNIYPEDFRLPQPHDSGEYLLRTGKNIASVLRNIQDNHPENFVRICEYLSKIVTEIHKIEHRSLGPSETIEFFQSVAGQANPWRFFAAQMSDGTLRSLGILIALFQTPPSDRSGLILGIEEPEATIHPAACAILTDAIIEASRKKQILITTHSPELIDHPDIDVDNIRIVQSDAGDTTIRMADEASRSVVKDELMTPGELLRVDQLKASPAIPRQMDLFAK